METDVKTYIDNKIADVVRFSTAKYGDTPTDNQQLTPKAYVDSRLSNDVFGDGSDGPFAISSGTTSLDASGANLLIKNYTTFAITGTGSLLFSNPHNNGTKFILRVQGDVTITSSATRAIDLRGMGGQGAAGGQTPGSGATPGSTGTSGFEGFGIISSSLIHNGVGGTGGSTAASGSGGAGGLIFPADTIGLYKRQDDKTGSIFLACGSGGAGGGAGGSANGGGAGGTGGSGGDGGGVLIIFCGGSLNFTGTIDTSGSIGANGNSGTNSAGGGGGGGGGSGGMVLIIYETLTANAGTINDGGAAGGVGGSGDTANSASANGEGAGGGGGGGSIGGAGGAGGNAAGGAAGGNGNSAGSNPSAGGGGGAGGSGKLHPTDPDLPGGSGGAGGGNYGTNLLVMANNGEF